VTSRADAEAALQKVLEDLRVTVDASRTTLRIDIDEWGVDVDTPLTEATAPGVSSIRGASLDQRSLPTVQVLARERKTLVHNDCAAANPPPPQALLDVYGVKAQVLAPLVRKQQLIGWISVHYTLSPRVWTADEIETVENAATKVLAILTKTDATTRDC
jgi:maleate isomerase